MKRFNLSKELFFGSVLIGVLSLGLASCGAGGGGGGGVSTSLPSGGIPSQSSGGTTSQPSCAIASPSSLSFGSYIYQGTDYQDEPIITVYIDGQPVKLLVDTGDSGFVVNQSAVNIPSSDYYADSVFNGLYGDGSTVAGVFASATVCLNPSITNSCVVMPIGVITSGNAFSSFSEVQGDFGLASGFGSVDSGTILSGSSFSSFTGHSYPYYLTQEYCINSFTIGFYPLSNSYYEYASPTTPIGEISFGTNAPSTYVPFPFKAMFPSYTPGVYADTRNAYFDTVSNFNFLSTSVLQEEIPNFSSSSDENASSCFSNTVSIDNDVGSGNGVVNGGFSISYIVLNNSNGPYYSTTFTTEPSSSFCSSNVQWNVMTGNTMDIGPLGYGVYDEVFGLPEMLRHTLVWVLDNQGDVQGISIEN